MAIPKLKTKKVELTPLALAQGGAAVVLGVLALVLLASGVSRFRKRRSIEAALHLHDSGRKSAAIEECRSALARDEDYHPARQLLAKILTEEGKLAEAEKEYQALLERGFNGPHVHVGLGIVHLVRASQAADAKASIDAARKSFESGKGCPEAEIGLAQVKLLLALRGQGSLSEARRDFDQIRAKVESQAAVREKMTREGVLDLYAGHGRAAAAEGLYKDAARSFRVCYVYAPYWPVSLANLAYADAQRYATSEPVAGFKLDASGESFSSLMRTLANQSRPADDPTRDAWEMRELAVAYAAGVSGDTNQMSSRIAGVGGDRVDSLAVAAAVWFHHWTKGLDPRADKKTRSDRAYRVAQQLRMLLDRGKWKETGPDRADLLVTLACFVADSALHSTPRGDLAEPEKLLADALAIEKTNFRALRNLAVLKKHQAAGEGDARRKEELLQAAAAPLAEARKAAGDDRAKLDDLAAVEAWKP